MTNLTEQWVNIYKSKKHGSYWTGTFGYKTKEEAVKDLADKENYLTTVNIEQLLKLQDENTNLKELLKECRDKWVCYKPYDRDQLLKRIDKILANNKIQANTVACNKIQEKNNAESI